MEQQRWKKLTARLLYIAVLLILLSVGTLYVSASSETEIAYPVEGGDIYFDTETGTITDCDSSVTSVVIPTEIEGVAVTSIGNSAFSNCESLTSVTISDSVTSIGEKAFYSCTGLTNVVIPYSVSNVGTSAFANCTGLTSATIGDSVTSIGRSVFSGCTSLTSVTIPDSVRSIGNYAFSNCTSLTSVTIPDSVVSIGNYAFYSCDALRSVTIGVSVASIGDCAFRSCSSLTSITIPASVTTIGDIPFEDCVNLKGIWVAEENQIYCSDTSGVLFNKANSILLLCPEGFTGAYMIPDSVESISAYAFRDCTALTSIVIPNSVTSIGYSAFAGCDGLTSMTIPGSGTSIDDYAFRGCSNLESVIIGNGVITIGEFAFYYCDKLTSVTIGNSVTNIGRDAFCHCASLTAVVIPDSVTSIGAGSFSACKSLTSVTIGDNVTSIGDCAFEGCTSLSSVTIPNSVASMGVEVFSCCTSLSGIWVDEENPSYSSDVCGVLFNKDKTELIQCPGGYSGKYTIPAGVTSIRDNAFYNCDNLRHVTIGDSVVGMGEYAFASCDSLTNVTIPDSITTISFHAFSYCDSLASVTFGDSVMSIDESAFYYCVSLTSMTIPDTVTSINRGAFGLCTGLTNVIIGDGVTSIGQYAFSDCYSLKSVTIGASVTQIRGYAFFNCRSLSDVYYSGTKEAWDAIDIGIDNGKLTYATIHYNYQKPTEPILDESLNPTMNITAGAEMSVNYSIMASDVSEYEDFYLVVEKEMADGETVSTTYGVVEEKSTRSTDERQPLTVKYDPTTGEPAMYSATYEGVNAKEMGDSFTTTLYGVSADGTLYRSVVESSSMKEYLLSRFDAANATTELKTMVIDMLKYGAAAQVRLGYNIENLVTADLTEEQLAYATQEIPEAVNNAASTGVGASVNTNITVTSRVQLNLSCVYTTATDPNAIKCVVTDSEGKVLSEMATTNKGGIMFSAIYENVGAKQMRDVINATFYEGETAISKTISWSVESYVAQVRAKTNVTEDELNMVNAMLTYGDAVAAYMEAK